ncbi:MAG: aminotransferase class V-fold PLP-dependent enzyme [Rickettsiales bacterium]|nr:aminotransferase class V-fold PLP-dependent enzyme [Rickettsiales bacterium]
MNNLIPVLKPKLPTADKILPYLQQIDHNRWYGNFGPLVLATQERIAKLFGSSDAEQVVMVANGTIGLTVALQALEVQRGGYCVMPSWTFTATPAAALAAGLTPAFIDVDIDTQSITPQRVKAILKSTDKLISAIIPVSPFGHPIDVAAWDRFTEETGIPVVIDAAAAFDSFATSRIKIGHTPTMISMHATKIMGTGEGGLLVSTNKDVNHRIRKIINFGFESNRLSHRIAINGKPSEYNAAIAMAVLDEWPLIRSSWAAVQQRYIDAFTPHGIECWMHPEWVTTTCNIIIPDCAVDMSHKLRDIGIDNRRWWETGCHAHPAYRTFPVLEELANTQFLGQSMLGVPAAMDISAETQAVVVEKTIQIFRDMQQNAMQLLA